MVDVVLHGLPRVYRVGMISSKHEAWAQIAGTDWSTRRKPGQMLEDLAVHFAAEMDAFSGGYDVIDVDFPAPEPLPPPPPPLSQQQQQQQQQHAPLQGDPIAALAEQGRVYAGKIEQLDLGPIRNSRRAPDKAGTRDHLLMRSIRQTFLEIKEQINCEFQRRTIPDSNRRDVSGGGVGGVGGVTKRLVLAEIKRLSEHEARDDVRLHAEAWFHCTLEDYESERQAFLRSTGQSSDRKAARLRRWALEIASGLYQSIGVHELPPALLRAPFNPSPPWLEATV